MGGYSSTSNQVQQTVPINVSLHCQPAYYKGSNNEFVFVWSENDQLRGLSFNRNSNTFDNSQVVSTQSGPYGQTGAELSVSSNGIANGTGILWAAYQVNTGGVLRAFDANDIAIELWNSTQNPNDFVGDYAKFSSPTVANGHVYLATFSNHVVVYGLKQ
jgi:hypothetical protein